MEFLSRNLSMSDVYSSIRSIRFDSIFAIPYFVELLSKDAGKIRFYVEISDVKAGTSTITPIIITKFKPCLRTAFCPSPPQVVNGPNEINKRWKEMLNMLICHIKENHNCIVISLMQRPHDPKFIMGSLHGCKLSRNYDVMFDLSNQLDTVYFSMDKRHRYTLRKASGCSDDELLSDAWLQKTSFMIKQGESQESLREFRALWIKTLKRMYKSFNPWRKLLYRDPLTLNSLIAVFNKLHSHGLVKLFTICDNNGQPGASAIFYASGNFTKVPTVYWSAGASSEEGRMKGLPLLLQWYIIQWFRKHGYQRYYMGGYDAKNPNDGPSLFKKGFGGQIVSGLNITWLAQPLRPIYDLVSYTARLTSITKMVF